MIKKIFKFLIKFIVGLFVFYLALGFIILPLLSSWVIPWQGRKILKSPVKIGHVFFNPLTLNLNISDLKILDNNKETLLGFDKFSADLSAKSLLKKTIKVELIDLEGLKVNVALLADGQINLFKIIPHAPSKNAGENEPQEADNPKIDTAKNAEHRTEQNAPGTKTLPLVILKKFTMSRGTINFKDQTVQPNFSTTLSDMTLKVKGFSTDPGVETKLSFQAKIDNKGTISLNALMKPLKQPLFIETDFHLNDYAMDKLSPYVGKYTGKDLANGKMDITMYYRIDNNKITATHKLLIQHFTFGKKVESKDALSLPFGLAIALLEDPKGKINISLPVKGDMNSPDFEYLHLVGQVIRNFFIKLVTKPFSIIASMIGGSDAGTDELAYVGFLPGKDTLPSEEQKKLTTLAAGLKERPKLILEINGTFDPAADWKAIQGEVFKKNYAVLRKESSKPDSEVYQLLYQRHFGLQGLWNLTKQYKKSVGNYSDEKLIREIKRQMTEEATPDEKVLKELAHARAQKIYDFFLSSGFDEKRLTIGQVHSVPSNMNMVPTEFTLTVFE